MTLPLKPYTIGLCHWTSYIVDDLHQLQTRIQSFDRVDTFFEEGWAVIRLMGDTGERSRFFYPYLHLMITHLSMNSPPNSWFSINSSFLCTTLSYILSRPSGEYYMSLASAGMKKRIQLYTLAVSPQATHVRGCFLITSANTCSTHERHGLLHLYL